MADNNEIYELTHTVEDNEDNFEFDATEAASDLVVSPATFKLTHTRDGNTDEFDFGDGDTPTPTGDLSGGTVDFVEAASRTNIESGSTLSTLFSKIKKWFSDLKTVAFTGSYSDLSNTPSIPTVNNATITFTQGGVTKGSIDLNQSENETIALDAGGGGGSAPDVTGSATVDDNTGTPGVTVTTTGSGTQADPYNLAFAFTNLKGATGAQGATGPQGPQGIQGVQGIQGETGPAGADGQNGADGDDGVGIVSIIYKETDASGNYVYTVTLSDNNTYDITCPIGPQGIQGPTGATGETGATGATGPQGPAGPGVPTGGTAGQVLAKASGTNYDTEWITPSGADHHVYNWKAYGSAYANGGAFTDIATNLVYGVDIPSTESIIGCAPRYAGLPQCCVTNIWVNGNDYNRIYYTVWNFGNGDYIQDTVAEGAIITIDTPV